MPNAAGVWRCEGTSHVVDIPLQRSFAVGIGCPCDVWVLRDQRGVGLVSFARFPGVGCTLVDIPDAVAFQYVCRSVAGHSSFLRRCASSLGHAGGRLLGIGACVHGRCLLNGSAHLEEAELSLSSNSSIRNAI